MEQFIKCPQNQFDCESFLNCRDANEPVPGFETEPKTRFFWKIFKPRTRTRTRVWFFKNAVPEPKPMFKSFEKFSFYFCRNFQFLRLFSTKTSLNLPIHKKNNFSKKILLVFWCFFTKPNPNLNPKPDFLENFRTLNPNPNPELDFWKPGTQTRTRSNKFWKPTNRTSHYFVAGLHLCLIVYI